MKCNVTRSGGAGGSTDKWELIETFQGANAYVQTRTAEPDGTPYNFKAVMVSMKPTSNQDGRVLRQGFTVYTTDNSIGIMGRMGGSTQYQNVAAGGVLQCLRTNGALDAQSLTKDTDDISVLTSPITRVEIAFNSDERRPTNVQFKIYAVRY